MNTPDIFIKRQTGAALVVSLLILLVMTMIGVTAMQTTTMEERMAGNMNEMNVALQTAEATLRAGEADLESLFSTGDFSSGGGSGPYNFKFTSGDAPDPFASTSWADDNSNSKEYTSIDPGGNGNYGRYFIEEVGTITSDGTDEPCIAEHGEACDSGTVTTFRITARGTGKSGTASVVIRSNYGKLF